MNKPPLKMPSLVQRIIQTNGIRIPISEMGRGPLVLMIHD